MRVGQRIELGGRLVLEVFGLEAAQMRPGPVGTLKDTGPVLELSPAAGHGASSSSSCLYRLANI